MRKITDLEGVYELNVYLDEGHYDDTGEMRYKLSAYPVGSDGTYRVSRTHKPLFEGLLIKVPEGVDIYEAIPDATDTWMDSDGDGVPEWLVKQATDMIEASTGKS